jgi:hypothetical protein
MLKKIHTPLLMLIISLAFFGCGDEEFSYDINHLVDTHWGIPQIIEPGIGHIDLDAPTIFNIEGYVLIGTSRTDYWTIRGDRSIFLEQAKENWFIIDLSPERLYVEKTSYPDGSFIAKCLYEPLKK